MYGQKLSQLVTVQCVCCRKWTAIRLDPDDLDRHVNDDVFVQHAFADRSGKPYLSASDRELLLSAVCSHCWDLLCPDPIGHPYAYN